MNPPNISDIRTALIGQLRGDSALVALLARDPEDPSVPAILQGSLNQRPPVYPCVTYRLPDLNPDARFEPTNVEGGGPGPINDIILEAEVWSMEGHDAVGAIVGRIGTLLWGQRIALPAGCWIHRCEVITVILDQHDQKLNHYFALLRFRLRLFTP